MTINIPSNCEWLFNVTALGILYAVFHCVYKINRMHGVFPQMVAALLRISEALVQKGILKPIDKELS